MSSQKLGQVIFNAIKAIIITNIMTNGQNFRDLPFFGLVFFNSQIKKKRKKKKRTG